MVKTIEAVRTDPGFGDEHEDQAADEGDGEHGEVQPAAQAGLDDRDEVGDGGARRVLGAVVGWARGCVIAQCNLRDRKLRQRRFRFPVDRGVHDPSQPLTTLADSPPAPPRAPWARGTVGPRPARAAQT